MGKYRLKLNLQTFSTNIINRTDAEALIPVEVANEIIQGVPQQSAVMQLATRLPNMTAKQKRMPVLNSLPMAYFVNGDTGTKQTTKVDWKNKYLEAEEIAVIVPIPEAVLDDSDYDIWGQVRPRIEAAFGEVFDAAVLYGTNKPSTWPDGIVTQATAKGKGVALGTGADLYDDIMAEGGVIDLVEQSGFMVNGHVAAMGMRAKLRGLRDADGQPIFKATMQEGTRYQLDGEPMIFPQNGSVDPTKSLLIAGDWRQLVYSIRQDMTYKILTEAVIQDPATGDIVYNLAQQDMVALRCVMRLAWQIPNPINQLDRNEATRFMFSVLTPPVTP
ncbi:phage capsid family protein [Paenibacillus sp. 32O-W]|uniref:phage major capsid protein n=1 Tax=Paenibacillus sp. 32O-W TaxID=1695218 RepID=UPI0007217013|nr:phage major capsid protein [Paenibacillus sp. 32O-W]ALS27188.1 phage capsid family protein [Paenibacillus sp. 32O-W]